MAIMIIHIYDLRSNLNIFEIYSGVKITLYNINSINKGKDKQELLIKEALHIQQQCPLINKQFDSFPNILKLFNINSHIPPPSTPTPLQSNLLSNHATHNTQNVQSNDTSQVNSTLHAVSPNIRNRIDNFINSYRNYNTQPSSPPLTRSRTHARMHLPTNTLDQSPPNNTHGNI